MAYRRAAKMEVSVNGFRKAELWSPDRYVFTDVDFAATEVTDRPLIQEHLVERQQLTLSPGTNGLATKNIFSVILDTSNIPINNVEEALRK